MVLCVIGITTLNDYGKLEDLQVVANQVIANITEQKLPDTDEPVISGGDAQETPVPSAPVTPTPVPATPMSAPAAPTSAPVTPTTVPAVPTSAPVTLTPSPDAEVLSQAVETVPEYTSYTIVKGDTLISICTIRYGSLDRLQEICEINGIGNADNIQVGQTILLP